MRLRLLVSSTLVVLIAALVFLTITSRVSASTSDFVVDNFTADYYLSQASTHGQMAVTERIDVDYHDFNHGILRALPNSYKNHLIHLKINSVSSPSGAPAQFTTYKSNDNTVLKIGDPNRTVTGRQSYEIKYSMENVISFYSDHDELFWDINGDQWPQPFFNVTARLHIPANLADKLQARQLCYTGSFGSLNQYCEISRSDENGGQLITASANNLAGYQTLSVVLAFNSKTFQPYTWHDSLRDFQNDIVIGLLSLIALAISFRRWWLKGRDPKGTGIVVPQYAPPKNISVLDAGILQDYRLDNKDITAVIIDLAVRGYITIIETDKKLLGFKRGTNTSLRLKNAAVADLKDYEIILLQKLFDDDLAVGTEVSLGKYIPGMQGAISSIGRTSLARLTKDGLFDANPQKPGVGLLILMLITEGIITFIGYKIEAFFGATFSLIIFITILVLAVHMPRRSRLGVVYNDDLKGLKMYLSLAEADRIKMMQSPGAPYAENANEPKRTVKLFEKLLPFAIIFGVEKQWAGQFADIYKSPPDWYQGNWTTFNAVTLANHISTGNAAFNTSFSPPGSSGGSGFGGGGAGGGGGGGGGGGW